MFQIDRERFKPLDLNKRNGPKSLLNFRRQTLRGVAGCPDEQDSPLSNLSRQYGKHAEVKVIFHFSLNRVIGTLTGKKCADNRLVRYMTIAVSFFHMPPPFQKPPAGVSRPIVYLTRVTLCTVEGVVVYDLSFKANGFEISSSTADLFMENSVSPLQARQALFATLSKLSA